MGEIQESSLHPQPLSYALPGALRIQRRRRIVGISSVVVGALALLLSGLSFFGSLEGMSRARRDIAANKHVEIFSPVPGPLEEPKDSYNDDFYASFILGALVLLAIMLLVGAVMLLRSDRRGLVLHWMYIPFQILASIALAADVMWS